METLKSVDYSYECSVATQSFAVFFCEWDSRAKDKRYKIKDLPMPENSFPGEKYVRNRPLRFCYRHYTLNWG